MPDRRTPTRRQLLAAAGMVLAAGTSGCASGRDRTGGSPVDGPVDGTVDSAGDAGLAQRAAREAAVLLAAYRATLRSHGELSRALRPLGTHHGEHLAVLAPQDPPRVKDPPAPGLRREALAALRRREHAVARSRRDATVDAESGDLARILASVAACQAQHLQILDQLLEARVRRRR